MSTNKGPSLPLPKNKQELEQVLLAMLDPDNNRRQAAANCLEAFFKVPACVQAMMQQMSDSNEPTARQMAAVLLRKKLSALLWRQNEKHWSTVQETLLRRLVAENVWPVQKAVAALACRVAKLSVPDGRWPQLVPFLTSLIQKPNEKMRTVGMLLFRAMGENLGQTMVQSINVFAQVVSAGLKDPSVRVRAEAFRAMEGVVCYLDTKEQVTTYQKLIPLAVNSAQQIFKKGNVEEANPALELFNHLADSPVPVLEPYLVPLVKFLLEVSVKADNLAIADTAMRFVQSVVEAKPQRIVRAQLVPDVLKVAFSFLVKPDDNPFLVDENTPQKTGVAMIAAMVESIPYKHLYRPCLQTSVKLIKGQSPHQRRAGLAIIAAIAEGFSLLLRECLPQLLDASLGLLRDNHPMVRVAACVCLLQLCDHIQPDIRNHHERLIKAMVQTLDRQGEHPMVRVRMTSALCAFVESLDKEVAQQYVKPLMTKFGQMVNGRDMEMRKMAVGGIQAVAIAAEEKFLPYLNDAMRAMVFFMSQTQDEMLELRAAATDCVGCIAAAVGANAFGPMVARVLTLADQNFKLNFYALNESTFRLYANLANCLGPKFAQILPKVHGYAIKSLESMDGVEIRAPSNDMSAFHREDAFENEDDLLRQMEYSIRSGAVDEKAAAIQAIASFAEFTGSGFLPFMPKTIEICKDCLEYPHEWVRHGVAAVLHELIKSAHKLFPNKGGQMQQGAKAIVGGALPLVLEMMKLEPDKQCCAEAAEAATCAVKNFGMPALQAAGGAFAEVLDILLQEKGPCQAYHGSEEDEKDEADHDEVLIDRVTDLLSAIAKASGPGFEPLFRRVTPHLLKFNQPHRAAPDRVMAIGTLGDIVEEMGPRVKPYLKDLFPVVIKALTDQECGVRRNAAYTVGVFAIHGKEAARPYAKPAITALSRLLELRAEHKGDDGYEACRDNACSAISKLMGQDVSLAREPKVVNLFMTGLPLLNDQEEAKEVYPRMAQLLRQGGDAMKAHHPHALFICARVFMTPDVSEDVKRGLVPIAKTLAAQIGKPGVSSVMNKLTESERATLAKVLG
mmetsp:Transcript_18617/g.35855  ORF Transcript_18617/g.35855 Transcript_18617/m.35855 type:complete len:1068 (-) Transcript_18617:161-3364(-)